jgi:hypothetical protein
VIGPPVAATVKMSPWPLARTLTKAIRLAFGDQVGWCARPVVVTRRTSVPVGVMM